MGMYDSVYVKCPAVDCHGRVQFQSKRGDCSLRAFTPEDVPVEIMCDLEGEQETCPRCGRICTIVIHATMECRWRRRTSDDKPFVRPS